MTDAAFYEDLPRVHSFEELSRTACYHSIPSDWSVGVADIKGSTEAIAQGRYKTVNMIGAAVISAQINGMGGQAFPYVFGGDGAAFAVGPGHRAIAANALAAVQHWAMVEFNMELRIALVPVRDILAAGRTIGVARYQVSAGVDYAMFNGGGVSWAEAKMKSGKYALPPAPDGTVPDLKGLSCRWSPVDSRNGSIVSLVLQGEDRADATAYSEVIQKIVALTNRLDRAGHPVPEEGPVSPLRPPGITLEAHASRGRHTLGRARLRVLMQVMIGFVLFRTGLKIGNFDPRYYARAVGRNADFRKFDDGLKMTLDCDPETRVKLERILEQARADGIVKYGLFQQDRAMMTCIVPSVLTDDHVHFVDGASGGYTRAAAQIKSSH